VSISNDGTTWYIVKGADTLDRFYSNYEINLDDEVIRIQNLNPDFSYTNKFYIKFQQYDN